MLYKVIESEYKCWEAVFQALVAAEAQVYSIPLCEMNFSRKGDAVKFLNQHKARVANEREIKRHIAKLFAAEKNWLSEMRKKDKLVRLKLGEFAENRMGMDTRGIGRIIEDAPTRVEFPHFGP